MGFGLIIISKDSHYNYQGDDKTKIQKYFAMAAEDLTDWIERVETIIDEAEEDEDAGVEKLQAAYVELMEEHEGKVKRWRTILTSRFWKQSYRWRIVYQAMKSYIC